VREGQVLIRQGEVTGTASDTFYIIHQGEVAITKDMGDG
jgi:CRP-like cAMP-binding protein